MRPKRKGRGEGRAALIITNYRDLWQAISDGLQFYADTRNRQEDGALSEDNDGRTVN